MSDDIDLSKLYDNSPYYFCRDGKWIELDEDEAYEITEAYCEQHDLYLESIPEE